MRIPRRHPRPLSGCGRLPARHGRGLPSALLLLLLLHLSSLQRKGCRGLAPGEGDPGAPPPPPPPRAGAGPCEGRTRGCSSPGCSRAGTAGAHRPGVGAARGAGAGGDRLRSGDRADRLTGPCAEPERIAGPRMLGLTSPAPPHTRSPGFAARPGVPGYGNGAGGGPAAALPLGVPGEPRCPPAELPGTARRGPERLSVARHGPALRSTARHCVARHGTASHSAARHGTA